jgi:uncharacterized phosphosugar-binding protein
VEAIVCEAPDLFTRAGLEPPILRSHTIEGAAEHHERLRQRLLAK